MNSPFKFLRRVRIHGGECGAVARALHHEAQKVALTQNEQSLISDECVLLRQADDEKSSKSTFNERKQMSTKTTFKRIALVAVASMGFGMISVAPSFAAEADIAEVTAVTVAAPATGRIGSALASAVGFTTASTAEDGDEITLAGIFVSRPAGSTATIIFDNTGIDITGPTTDAATFTAASGFLPSKLVVDSTGAAYTNGTHVAGRVGFVPDVAGDYEIKVWHDQNGNGAIDPTEAVSATRTFTVGAAPTTVTATRINSSFCSGTANGALVKLALPTGTGLALGEAIRVTPSTATADITLVNGSAVTYTPATTTYIDLVGSQFIGGVAWLNITDSASVNLTLAGQGTAVSAIAGTVALTVRTCATGDTGTTVIQGATAGAAFTSITDGINGNSTTATIPLAAKTITYYSAFTAGAAAGDYFGATVTDSDGRVTGSATQAITGLKYDLPYLGAANATTATTIEGTFGVTLTPTATSQGFNVTTLNGTALVSGVTTDTSAMSAGTVTVSPSSALSLKTGGSITYTVTVKDKFARAVANAVVDMVITGRNANQTVIAPTAVTSSTGIATFTLKDGPAAGTTSLSDSIVFRATGSGTDTSQKSATAVTISWSATGPVVGTVTILGGNNTTTTGVAATAPAYKDINAGATGAQATTADATATVKDASGNLLAGVPVTFTVTGTTAAITSTTATVYTGATGTATAKVYAWAAGSYTVTATAGDVSGTAVYQFRQSGAGEERSISASVSGAIVTAKVVDRFGNPVPSVMVYATKTGVGYFGTGNLKTSGSTDNDGVVSFLISGGAAEVTVATYDAGTATAPLGSGQTCARAGAADCNIDAADDTAFSASVAGTTTANEKGVGASFSAAGVSSAKVSVTDEAGNAAKVAAEAATDAAAEAIDAANAATDAANLAAEAADAATVAAEEARDAADAATAAVEELATQVATLMAALKAQITTLANTVAKIAKKVKA
jgi:hypothetical protein